MAGTTTQTQSEENSSLQTITEGASLFFVGKIVSNGLGFLFNFILTQVLGATLYGIYTYANTIVGFVIVLARLGTGKSLLRFIPATAGDQSRQDGVTGLAYLTALTASIVIGTALFVTAPLINGLTLQSPLLTDVLRVLALVLPFNTLSNLTNSVFRATEKLEYQVLLTNILKPAIRILVVLIAFALGYSLIGAVAALAIGGILIFGIAMSLLYSKTEIRLIGGQYRGNVSEFYNYSLPLTLKDLGQKLYTRVDILMVGLFLSGSTVGVYRISILLATFLTLPLAGVNQLFPPIASNLYAEGKTDELESVYKVVTRWVFTIVILPSLAIGIYSSEVLGIFGQEFTSGAFVLVLFAIGQLTNAAVGPSGFLLMMTDHQYLNLLNQWTLGVSNIALNYLFITEFGFIGAAVATAGALALINVVRVIEVWIMEGMTPYSRKYWKPLVAGACGLGAMFGCQFFLDGYPLLVTGVTAGSVVYLGALLLFGIESEDREFYMENINPRLR